jgi:hypothetical protein
MILSADGGTEMPDGEAAIAPPVKSHDYHGPFRVKSEAAAPLHDESPHFDSVDMSH